MNRQVKYTLLAIAFGIMTVIYITSNYSLMINGTGSLGNWAFLVKHGTLPTKVGQYAAFYPPANPYYDNKPFIKIVGGMEGDTVAVQDRLYSIGGKEIGLAKEFSLKGDKLDPSPAGIIPAGQYFMYATHKDSYDSRYLQMGWISEGSIIGIAIPVL
jgi:conjugal transfer pilin signal peptidase TrbI